MQQDLMRPTFCQVLGTKLVSMTAFLLAVCGCNPASPPAVIDPAASRSTAPVVADAPADTITLLVAASTANALKDVADLFQTETGIKVEISVGSSNALAQQIIAGASADVFISASPKWADALVHEKKVAETRSLVSNRLVIVVQRGNPARIQQPVDLTSDRVRHVALAGESVPAGMYADQALRTLGLTEKLSAAGRIVRGHDVRVTLSYVEQGEAEAGIVYATDAKESERVEVVYTFDASTHELILYPAVLIERQENRPAARNFFEFLFSDAAMTVFQRHGFLPPSSSEPNAEGPR